MSILSKSIMGTTSRQRRPGSGQQNENLQPCAATNSRTKGMFVWNSNVFGLYNPIYFELLRLCLFPF
jgi:hypothetical protein